MLLLISIRVAERPLVMEKLLICFTVRVFSKRLCVCVCVCMCVCACLLLSL